jgi:hypothetical protein
MSEPFQPFTPSRGNSRPPGQPLRLSVLAHAGGAPLPGPARIEPTLPPQPPAGPPPPAAEAGRREPQVTIERDGDRITRILIRCSCGQLHELLCTS